MSTTTLNSTEYDPDDYVSIKINLEERAEKRRIRKLNEKFRIGRKK